MRALRPASVLLAQHVECCAEGERACKQFSNRFGRRKQDLSDSVSVLASSVLHFSRVMLAGAGFVMLDRKCEHMHQTSSTYCA